MIRQQELIDKVASYIPNLDDKPLNKAYVFAVVKHGAQKRESGDPYYQHPVEVAAILAEKKLDLSTIICGLLHDTVEDTDASIEEIATSFGDEIAFLVNGLTKVPSFKENENKEIQQAENLRKLFLASTKDIRVLLVKLADRLHNMRTLHYVKKKEKRIRIAKETLDIYSPICERVGLKRWGDEMANLAFQQLEPEAYDALQKRLVSMFNPDMVKDIRLTLKRLLMKHDIKNRAKGRQKQPFSIWAKAKKKHVGIENLSDILAFRLILQTVEECYIALGIIHTNFHTVPGRFKDYISAPKKNGYKSIHTIIQGPQNQRIEVQIRTEEMDDFAENGIAAHWGYKEEASLAIDDTQATNWIRSIMEKDDDYAGFLEKTKMSLYSDRIFVSSPKGDYYELPKGATPVDFAYAVHTELGKKFLKCHVNGASRPALYKLQNGDQVSITTDEQAMPVPTWKNAVKTHKARYHVDTLLRNHQKKKQIKLGRQFIAQELNKQGLSANVENMKKAIKRFGYTTPQQLYHAIGSYQLDAKEAFFAIFPRLKYVHDIKKLEAEGKIDSVDSSILFHDAPFKKIFFCNDCRPIAGDIIHGIIDAKENLHVHRSSCLQLDEINRTCMYPLKWQKRSHYSTMFKADMTVSMSNKPGLLGKVCEVMAEQGANIYDVHFMDREIHTFSLLFTIDVVDVNQCNDIISSLQVVHGVIKVERHTKKKLLH